MKHLLSGCLLLTLAVGCPGHAAAKKKPKAKLGALLLGKDSTAKDEYGKIVKGGVKKQGLFTVIFKAKDNKLYFEIPDSAFGRTYMLANRVASTSNAKDYVAGQMVGNPMVVNFTKDERSVYMNLVQAANLVAASDPIRASFDRNFLNPILKAFKIVATHGHSVVIDVSAFFGTNEACLSPIKTDSPITKLLGGGNSLKGTYVADASGLNEVKAFERNIEIKSTLSYNLTGGLTATPYSVRMHRSLFVLPDDPMPKRYQDNRVGYFSELQNLYSSDKDRVEQRSFIRRWRVEPRPEDRDRYFRGELVEPQRKIVFYVDSAFPAKWRQTIKDGILVWNKAFEAAGFKHVIEARDYPAADSLFDPDDMRYNCFKYATTATPNAMGPSHSDPRTGEILCADVLWYHNIVSLLHNWRFVQTGAVDERVRRPVFDDELMRQSIKYAASHEVGHTLGLMHNMGASYAFPVDSLRSPSFTRRYGTTPSIMDYARNNYVAQPGDPERGVSLLPPELGVYDVYAINWGYRLVPGAATPAEEKPELDRWIAAKAGDPMYEFGAQQMLGTIDPTDLTEDLGNDHVKAGDLGISNLKIVMRHLLDWTMERGERYDAVEDVYKELTRQYSRYLGHVMPLVGGIEYKEVRQGDGQPAARRFVSRARQREAMHWLLRQARSYDAWLTPADVLNKMEIDLNVNDKIRTTVVSSLLNGATLYRIREGGLADPRLNYPLDTYLSDLTQALFIAPRGGRLTAAEQQLQGAAIAQMMRASGLEKAEPKKAAAAAADVAAFWRDATAPSTLCDYGHIASSFSRINLGSAALSQGELGAIMLGRLRAVLAKYRSYRNQAVGSTRDFYNYQVFVIERLLNHQ